MDGLGYDTDVENQTTFSHTEPYFFDLTDMLTFLRDQHIVTGIQRVQMEAARAALRIGGPNTHCCFFAPDRTWRLVEADAFLSICGAIEADDRGKVDTFLGDLAVAPLAKIEPGSVILFFGATWSIVGLFESLRELRSRGVECVFYMHDLLPLTHPEYFDSIHVTDFGYWLMNALTVASGILCNSNETLEALKGLGGYSGPSQVVDLNVVTNLTKIGSSDAWMRLSAVHGLQPGGFVLMVGTLEPRKNHVTAINAWVALKKELGARCPTLVIVGRRGWKDAGIVGLIDAFGDAGNVIWLESVSDVELAHLYLHCYAKLFISRAEGWGLPVSEALAVGKLVICGRQSAVAAAKQSLVFEVDERSERDVTDTLVSLINEPNRIAEHEKSVHQNASFKSWPDFTVEAADAVKSMNLNGAPKPAPEVALSRAYSFGHSQPFALLDVKCFGDSLLGGAGWHSCEDWGVWSCSRRADLNFRLPSKGSYDVYLRLAINPTEFDVKLTSRGATVTQTVLAGNSLLKAQLEHQDDDLNVVLTIECSHVRDMREDHSNSDVRILGVGISEFVVSRRGDAEGRLAAFERFL